MYLIKYSLDIYIRNKCEYFGSTQIDIELRLINYSRRPSDQQQQQQQKKKCKEIVCIFVVVCFIHRLKIVV